MALTIGPAYSVQARGKVGGVTYCSGSEVSIAKPTTFGCNSLSARQTAQRREIFAVAVHWWTNLSTTHRDLWEDLAKNITFVLKLGRPYTPTGRQVFFRLACSAQTADYAPQDHPPNQILPEYFPTLDITWTVSGAQITWDTAIPSNTTIVVSQKRNLNLAAIRPRKTVQSHWFTDADSSPQIVCPPLGGGGGPGDLPACNVQKRIHLHAWLVDHHVRTTVRQFWN